MGLFIRGTQEKQIRNPFYKDTIFSEVSVMLHFSNLSLYCVKRNNLFSVLEEYRMSDWLCPSLLFLT